MPPSLDALPVVNALPGAHLVLLPDPPRFTIAGASDAYLEATFLKREWAIGRGLFETNTDDPDNPQATGVKNLRKSLQFVLEQKAPHRMADQRYDIMNPVSGQFELRVWRPLNSPVLDEAGHVQYIIHTVEDVTETIRLREAEQRMNRQLEAQEATCRGLFASMDQGFCLIEILFDEGGRPVDFRWLEANGVFEQQTGLKEPVGKKASELIPGLEPFWVERYGNVARTGNPHRFVDQAEALGRWFDVHAFRIEGEGNHKVGILFTDITERKKAEEALLQSENNLRNVILQAPVAMGILKGPSFTVELANARLYELWGRGPEELLHRSIFDGLPEARNQGYEELLTEVFTTGNTFAAFARPVTLPRNGGTETVYVNLVYEAFRQGDGTISGVMVVATEVTSLVVANLQVEESHRELQFVMDVMPHLAWSTRPDGYADFFNQGCLDYTGLSMRQLTGNLWTAMVHPDDAATTWKTWNEALAGMNDHYSIEHRLRGKDGLYRWFLTRAIPLKNEQGAILKWFGTSTNIEDQKAAEEFLEQRVGERTEELERRNKELQQFAHISHHDLQEPLRKILLFSDKMKADADNRLSPASGNHLDKILASAHRMSRALREVLDFASLDKEEAFVPTDLNEVLAAVQVDLELLIHETNARIVFDPLPTIRAVPHQMHQLFYNLIGNALKFTKPGQPPLITITCTTSGTPSRKGAPAEEKSRTYYQITLKDNGIGFNQEWAEKIFELFQRLHSRETYAGTGIGLALCKKVVLNHGGQIWADGAPGEGAAFTVLLPAELPEMPLVPALADRLEPDR
ncbi:PAS domain-containing protein [Paraflavisolibacter sp. H34]|uniref:PAS domain-containing sensor histidine kinase n=1 Tax=Huijunlia imazamoxiresistens TaxID=3127457 RepID=UPI00301A307B